MTATVFSDRERYIILELVEEMPGTSFGEALELLDRLFDGGIFPRGDCREAVDTGQLGALIRAVGHRYDIPDRDRRLLMCRLAIAGLGGTPPVDRKGILRRIHEAVSSWSRTGSRPASRPFFEDTEEIERFVRHVSAFFEDTGEIERSARHVSAFFDPPDDPGCLDIERLNRIRFGEEVYDPISGVWVRPEQKKKTLFVDHDESDARNFWFWEER
jgi:hypothetical protein